MSLRAVIFDFDGLILNTEEAELEAWQALYRDHGADLSYEEWCVCIGSAGLFDPHADLERKIGRKVDRDALYTDFRARDRVLLTKREVLPGVVDRLQEAIASGIRRAIASSSAGDWVPNHLKERGLTEYFEAVVVRNDQLPAKPKPDLYLAALRALGVAAHEAVAFEDSMNGIKAAKAAGMYCVAVPNPVTAPLDLSAADRRIESLAHITLAELARTAFNGNGHR